MPVPAQAGRYSHRIYVAYSTFYVLGTLMSMQVVFVSWAPVSSPEHLAAFGVFILLHVYNGFFWLRSLVTPEHLKGRWSGFRVPASAHCVAVWCSAAAVAAGRRCGSGRAHHRAGEPLCSVRVECTADRDPLGQAISGQIPFLTGRLWALLGATSNIAIVKSVSEHQPSPWTTFFFDLHCLVFLVPVGIYFCFHNLSDANMFIVLYVLFASYFSSIMVSAVGCPCPSHAKVLLSDPCLLASSPHSGPPGACADARGVLDGRHRRLGHLPNLHGRHHSVRRTRSLVPVVFCAHSSLSAVCRRALRATLTPRTC